MEKLWEQVTIMTSIATYTTFILTTTLLFSDTLSIKQGILIHAAISISGITTLIAMKRRMHNV